jgi:hypothetical protein
MVYIVSDVPRPSTLFDPKGASGQGPQFAAIQHTLLSKERCNHATSQIDKVFPGEHT